MTQYYHKANILVDSFPLLSEDVSQTVLIPQFDTESEKQQPSIYYAHNIMPTKEGVVSVGYENIVTAVVGDEILKDIRIIFGNAYTRLHLAISVNGALYILKPNATAWLEIPFNSPVEDTLITIGVVNGISYVFFRGLGCYIYNEAADLFVNVPLKGLDESVIIGITSAYGYLLAYTEVAIAWSSTVIPSDFVPSAVTGAGGGGVAEARGKILFAVPNSLGIIIYTEANAVAATYTGNKQYPFKLREVTGSNGALNLDLVAYEANANRHFVISKGGLQALDSRDAQPFLPELSDFLAGERVEDFDETTLTFTITNLTDTMMKKVKLISNRFLVVSYGITEFTHAVVYDLVLGRLGKLKFTHTDVFEWVGTVHEENIGHTIGMLKNTGEVYIVDTAVPDQEEGVLLLGRYQYFRSRTLVVQEVTIANVAAADNFSCHVLPSRNGTDLLTAVIGSLVETGVKYRRYCFDVDCANAVLVLIGKMDLNSIILVFTPGGRY